MLREMAPLRQPDENRRRWFASPRSDLIVWLRDDDTVDGFQFCYDKDKSEHALTWLAGKGFSHMRVDTGRNFGQGGQTPLLVANGTFDAPRILEIFRAESALLPPELSQVVSQRLQELTTDPT